MPVSRQSGGHRRLSMSVGQYVLCRPAALRLSHVLGTVLVRDTKDSGVGPVLGVTPAGWVRFTRAVRANAVIR